MLPSARARAHPRSVPRTTRLACALLILVATGATMAAPSPINAPPAAATLVLTGSAARVDRAADSARAVRLTLEGVPPALASIPVAPRAAKDGEPAPQGAPLIQPTAAALAAVPPGVPVVLILTTADGAQRSLVATVSGTPQWFPDSGTASLDAELVGDEGARVGLARGAASLYLSAPGGLGPTNLPGRLASAGSSGNGTATGAALLIDVAIV